MSKAYKLPRPKALALSNSKGSFSKLIVTACKKFNHAHPEWEIPPESITSLSKRIEGELRVEFCRLIADREILRWLFNHQEEWPELCKMTGALRLAIFEEMKNRGDIEDEHRAGTVFP